MPRVQWGIDGIRIYQTGIDRGMLYVSGSPGVAWNGLIKVTESPEGGAAREFFIDGQKYIGSTGLEEYAATIEAFSSPREFAPCSGSLKLSPGLYVTGQPRKPFGFSYRTLIGSDLQLPGIDYKVHLVYNALAKSSDHVRQTISKTVSVKPYSWTVTTIPEVLPKSRPSAHFILDTRKLGIDLVLAIEDILYGNEQDDPRLLTPQELLDMIGLGFSSGTGLISMKKLIIDIDATAIEGSSADVSISMKKMKPAGAGTGRSAATAAPKMKKMKPAGSGAGTSAATAAPKMKKMSVSGSGTVGGEASEATVAIGMKKFGTSGLVVAGQPFAVGNGYGASGATDRQFPVSVATETGDTLVITCASNNTGYYPTEAFDSKGNIYTLDKQTTTPVPTQTIFRSPGATGGSGGGQTAALTTSDTFTIRMNSTSGAVSSCVTDIPGSLTDGYDVIPASISTGSSTTPSASVTPAQDFDICLLMVSSGSAGGDPTVNSPFTKLDSRQAGASGPWASTGYTFLGSGTSGNSQTGTETVTTVAWKAINYAFKRRSS